MAGKRAIFEEVGTAEKTAPRGGMIDARPRGARRGVMWWLIALFVLVVVMIAVGGLTRLTDSGLSITEWRPVTGAIPPLNAADWQAEFDRYRAIPEYRLQNSGMSLAEFQVIYWWEWGHRQLGRVIGLVWAAGFLGFLAARKIPPGWTARLLLLGALGGLQGLVGWWMVSSGLEGTRLDVASYRLAVHLGLAFVILGVIAWYVLSLRRTEADLMRARRAGEPALRRWTTVLAAVTFLQIVWGALVAGIDAGRNYVDWPLMAGGFLPPDPFQLSPWWRNFFEDDGLVQFVHRIIAYALLALIVAAFLRARRSPYRASRAAFHGVLGMAVLQMVLGIATVMYSAPWSLAILHQFGAVVLWVLVLRARHQTIWPRAQSLRDAA
ncbi:cytochrome oxidase assembly [Oceaniovalibus guishaninsula JLT2003]|uniref:Heme A synthase n=1 Tax=Oceaniovalibus guishaninsula JLT2003 TaxID=1231392 RepID=K2HAJ0_9RHOB|nr:heme A synthase [Oceaniovalibus guishaninsula]EKE43637.1 cytochrome oxidase assembly [Oceaniovalibus guishaninsula JLT2003]